MAPVRANLAVAFVLCFAMVWRMAAWKGKGTGLASLASGIPSSSSSVLAVNETLRTRELADVVHRVASAVSAASMIQGTAKLADQSQATTGRMSSFPNAFCLSMTIVQEKIEQDDLKKYTQSYWDQKIPIDLEKYYADGVGKPKLASFAFISNTSESFFAYKRTKDANGVTHTGKLGQGKKICFTEPVAFTGTPSWATTFRTTLEPFTQYADKFGWLTPTQNREATTGAGAFVYMLKDTTDDLKDKTDEFKVINNELKKLIKKHGTPYLQYNVK